MSGASWTRNRDVADAIDGSQGAGGATVTLRTRDAELWETWMRELVGICTEQSHVAESLVGTFSGEDTGEPVWRVRCELAPASR